MDREDWQEWGSFELYLVEELRRWTNGSVKRHLGTLCELDVPCSGCCSMHRPQTPGKGQICKSLSAPQDKGPQVSASKVEALVGNSRRAQGSAQDLRTLCTLFQFCPKCTKSMPLFSFSPG